MVELHVGYFDWSVAPCMQNVRCMKLLDMPSALILLLRVEGPGLKVSGRSAVLEQQINTFRRHNTCCN